MPAVEFRLHFNNDPATRRQLDSIGEITIEQEVDMAWEARIEFPACVDENGNWTGEDEDFMQSFSRVRVEIKNGRAPFVPLIDGPVVKSYDQRSSQPGQSSITLHVQDDSMYLDREENVELFNNRSDWQIAEEIFENIEQIHTSDVERESSSEGGTGSSLTPEVVQRGTAMQILSLLAKRGGNHVYVLPGENAGESIGCFRPFPTQPDGLPQLVLLGPERNFETFNSRYDAQRPSRVRASTLSITDKSVTTSTSRFSDIEILGDEPPFENESDTATHILPTRQGESVDLDQAVSSEAVDSSYAFEVTGNVIGHCYPGILQPYRVVTVMAGNTKLSGNYLIRRVTHTLTRSHYSQSFTLRRNAVSGSAGSSTGDMASEMRRRG